MVIKPKKFVHGEPERTVAVSKEIDTKWNRSAICETAFKKFGTAAQKVEQVL